MSLNVGRTLRSYVMFREFDFAIEVANTLWRFFGPPMWVTAIFLVSLPLWLFLSLRSLGTFMLTLRLIPFFFLALALLALPFQESQEIFIQALDVVASCFDDIYNGIQLPSMNDIFHCLFPICQIWEAFWDYTFMIVRLGMCELRKFITEDLIFEIEAFLIAELGFSLGEAADIAQDIIDFLDVDPGVCDGVFFNEWSDLDPADYVDGIDLFWPPDKRDAPSWNTVMQMHRAFKENRSVSQARNSFEDNMRRVMGQDGEPERAVPLRSTWADEDNLWRKATFHSFKRWKAKQMRGIPTDSVIFDLFSDGPNGFNTVIFGFICGEFEFIATQLYNIVLFVFDYSGRFFADVYESFIDGSEDLIADGNPSAYFWKFIDLFWELLLDIPCIDFEDEESFFVSLFDCTCSQIVPLVPVNLTNFQYVEATQWEQLPVSIPCCIGFCCVMDGFPGSPELPDSITSFFDNMFSQCLGSLGAVEDAVADVAGDIADTTDAVEDVADDIASIAKRMPSPNALSEEQRGGSGRAPKEYVFVRNVDGGSGYVPTQTERWAKQHKRAATRKTAYMESPEDDTPPLLPKAISPRHQRAVDYAEKTLKTKEYPGWLKKSTGKFVRNHPEIASWFLDAERNTNPDPDEHPYEYIRNAIIGRPMRSAAESVYRMANDPPAPARKIGEMIWAYGGRVFDVLDAKLRQFGNTRSIDLGLLVPSGGKEHVAMHWLKRYSAMHAIEDERYVRRINYITMQNENGTKIELTDGQLALRASYILMLDTLDVASGITWNAQSFDFETPSYRDINAFLIRDARADITMFDMGKFWMSFFRDYATERAPRWGRPPVLVETEVMFSTLLRRMLVPERVADLEEQYVSYGGAYAEAAFRHVRPVRMSLDKEVVDFHIRMEDLYRRNVTRRPSYQSTLFQRSETDDWEVEAEQDEEEHGSSLPDTDLLSRYRQDLLPPENYTRPVRDMPGGRFSKDQVSLVRARLKMALTTGSARQYLMWRRDRNVRRERLITTRKQSYEFQRRVAHYLQKDLVRLDPDLPLPEEPGAEVTEEIAGRYYMSNHMVKFRRNDTLITRFLAAAYDKLFHSVPPRTRGIDPAIVQVFRDMDERTRSSFSPAPSFAGIEVPFGSRIGSRMTTTENFRMGMRDLARLPQLAPLIPIFFSVAKQWRWIVAAIVPFLSAPEFRVAARIGFNPYLNFMGDIYKEGLKPTFSLASLEEFGIEVGFSILEIVLYVITAALRFILCHILPFSIQFIGNMLGSLTMLIGGGLGVFLMSIFSVFTSTFSFFMPLLAYCPPVIGLDEDGIPTIEPWNYFFAILDCDPTSPCTDETDCPNEAPCRCDPPTPQYTSFFWSLDGDFNQNCPADSGTCLCWPRIPCNFQMDEADLSEPFEQDCHDEFGYEIDDIVWYQEPSFFDWLFATLSNTFISLQFVTRTIVRGYMPFFSQTVLLAVFLLFAGIAFAAQRYRWAITILILLVIFNFGTVLITETVSDVIIPALERIGDQVPVISWLTDFLLDFLRFDNWTDGDPVGSPETGEFVCWLFNSATFWMGLFVLSVIIGVLAGLLLSGFIKGVFSFFLFWFLWPWRRLYDCCALFLDAASLERVYDDDGDGDEEAGQVEEEEEEEGGYEDPAIVQSMHMPSTMMPVATSGSGGRTAPGLRFRFPERDQGEEGHEDEEGYYGSIPASYEGESAHRSSITRLGNRMREMTTARYWAEMATTVGTNAATRASEYGRGFAQSRAMNENAWEMPDYGILWRPSQ